LWHNAASYSPQAPNKLTGNIYRRNIHGLVVYQTYSEYREIEMVDLCSGYVFVTAFIIGVVAKNRSKYGTWYDRGDNKSGSPEG
jgi:hypothetical protein